MVNNPPAIVGDVRDMGWTPGSGSRPAYSSILAEESHGQRCLAGYSPWGHKESDMTDVTLHHTYNSA